MVNRDAIVAALHAYERIRADRVEIWINIIEMDGSVSQRIYRGSFQRPRDPHIRESTTQGRRVT